MSIQTIGTGKLGYTEYAALPNDGCRHEIVDGVHYVNPSPSLYHQAVLKRLSYLLLNAVERAGLGTVYFAPCDVQLADHDIVQPDLLVVMKGREQILMEEKVVGAPDLLVEILSPSTMAYDRVTKKDAYERAGVREYWIVDPFEHAIEQYVLCNGRYVTESVADSIRLHVANGVSIQLADVW